MDVNHERRGLYVLIGLLVAGAILFAAFVFWRLPSKQSASAPAECELSVQYESNGVLIIDMDGAELPVNQPFAVGLFCDKGSVYDVVLSLPGSYGVVDFVTLDEVEIGHWISPGAAVPPSFEPGTELWFFLYIDGKPTGEAVTLQVVGG